ncbi:HAT dimerization domain, Ribonuclease H-like domain protein [Artemisia annua]|uniref:HAT dimerization domain, Ribonuclease H-like domain protein n=1 Tax=Artemisia annua TaxID=35608 RepID=A0A2U1MTJ9_ARTAN|nr:HAT dimerization domain, Ribonuclease H-like domain protein [Artemisia annua]
MASQETQQETQGSSSTNTDQPPLWEYVTKLEKQGAAGKFICNLYSETRQGSYSRCFMSRNPNDDVKMWDVGGDAFDSMEDVGFLEFADLSLDEVEFENDLIIDN